MATLQQNGLSIVEIAKRSNNGQVLSISEVLSRVDDLWQDIPWVPCNQISAFVHNRRLSIPRF